MRILILTALKVQFNNSDNFCAYRLTFYSSLHPAFKVKWNHDIRKEVISILLDLQRFMGILKGILCGEYC